MTYDQAEFDIRLEWGRAGMEALAPISDVIIVVDVLSFSTCVDIATNQGAFIYPYRWKDESAWEYARSINAELADFNRKLSNGYSLSPSSLLDIKPEVKLVLPSPNGSALTLATQDTLTICGCLRNAEVVAEYAMSIGKKIALVPAGEQWPDHTLRAAFEDLLGAGAIISYLQGSLSPESRAAMTVFNGMKNELLIEVKKCSSGKEITERGFGKDLDLACALNESNNVPIFNQGCYIGHRQ